MSDLSAVRRCPHCGAILPSRFSFCGECGRRLPGLGATRSDSAGPGDPEVPLTPTPGQSRRDLPPSARPAPGSPVPERLQLTVMFCDLVGSTALSGRLDPEEFALILRSYQEMSARAIEEHGGHVAQYLGDGILVYFGYPVAHEDEARLAVLAGLEIVDGMRALHNRFKEELGVDLAVRVALHTGVVVVGEVGGGERRELMALGETPNVAARIQALADRNAVVISGATHALIGGHFDCESLGVHQLRGVAEPVSVYRVTGARSVELEPISGRTAVAERLPELAILHGLWTRAQDGRGATVSIRGEAGIGKSWLVRAFAGSVPAEDRRVVMYRCLPSFKTSPFYPVINALRRGLHGESRLPVAVLKERIGVMLARHGLSPEEHLPLFAGLLSLPLDGDLPPVTDSPQAVREKTQDAVITLLRRMSVECSLMVVVEDLHWADSATLDLVGRLNRAASDSRILALLTSRPDFRLPWPGNGPVEIELGRLDADETARIVAAIAGGNVPDAQVRELIAERTEGVPLFVEELTRMLLMSGDLVVEDGVLRLAGTVPTHRIPYTLQDSLEARLERMGPGKEIAQMAAAVGREIPEPLLRAVWDRDSGTLEASLEALVRGRILSVAGEGTDRVYTFEHALMQDVAYQSLVRERRQEYHRRVADALEGRFPEVVRENPEVVARHHLEADRPERALPHLLQAGRAALLRSANPEAIAHLKLGLATVERLPPAAERDAAELDFLAAIGPALIGTQGYSAQEAVGIYGRARELSRRVGSQPRLFGALFGLFTYYFVREEPVEARALAEELLDLANRLGDEGLRAAAHDTMAAMLLSQGELAAADTHAAKALALYDRESHGRLAFTFGQDFQTVALAYRGWIHWGLGFPDQAVSFVAAAMDAANSVGHPHSVAFAKSFATTLACFRGEPEWAVRYAREVIGLGEEQGFPHWAADARTVLGWALVQTGRMDEGIRELEAGRRTYEALGGELQLQYQGPIRVATYLDAGLPERAQVELAPLIDKAERGSRGWWWRGELYRLRGELARLDGRLAEADADFRRGLADADRTGARSFGLRAATSLARLLAASGRGPEARQVLTAMLGPFNEGLETRDLVRARTLAESLA